MHDSSINNDSEDKIVDFDEDHKIDNNRGNPVYRLLPFLRKKWRHPDFRKANDDLEQLSLARDFPEKVADLETISQRFKAFISSLSENEEALKDVENLLEGVKSAKK